MSLLVMTCHHMTIIKCHYMSLQYMHRCNSWSLAATEEWVLSCGHGGRVGGQLFASWGLRWITLWRRVHACVCVCVSTHLWCACVCVHNCVVRVCVCVCTLSLSAGSIIVHSAQPFCLRSNETSVSSRCTGQSDTLKFRRIIPFVYKLQITDGYLDSWLSCLPYTVRTVRLPQ